MAEDVEELRRRRVKELIQARFEGRQAAFARAIDRDPTYVSRMLRPPGDPHRRAIAEDMAAHIEQALDLPAGYMRFPDIVGKEQGRTSRAEARIWVVPLHSKTLPLRSTRTDNTPPVGMANEYAEISTMDKAAFLVQVAAQDMAPRYQAGEYALVEPGTLPESEDDVLVRLSNGETFLARLASRQGRWKFACYVNANTRTFRLEEVEWVYYVAHPVPAKRVRAR